MTKPILEVRSVLFDYQDGDEYEAELVELYESKTNKEYHIIVLFTQIDSIPIHDRINYPILKVL
jgi:hypothetical protein